MDTYLNEGRLVLSQADIESMYNALINPDIETIKKSNDYLQSLGEYNIQLLENGGFVIDIPDFEFKKNVTLQIIWEQEKSEKDSSLNDSITINVSNLEDDGLGNRYSSSRTEHSEKIYTDKFDVRNTGIVSAA